MARSTSQPVSRSRAESSSPWRRPSDDDRTRRLSDDWYPGEWLEPVEPDIVRPFLERYMEGMSRRMADYMRAQGIPEAADSDEGAVEGEASGNRRVYAVDFLNLCLIVDQEHTFPIGARNLADGFYEPDEETAMAAAMMLQFEFDRFVDFVSELDPHIDRHAFVAALREAYGYRGDIDSEGFLGVLAARTAGRMAAERLRDWSGRHVDGAGAGGSGAAGAGGGAWERRIRSHLDAWGVTAHDVADHGGFAAMLDHALDHAKDHWARCVAGARRHTPRARRDVEAWCVWHAVLEIVWGADRRAYDVRWNGVDMPERDSRRFGGLPSPERGGTMVDALDGSAWNTLMGRMVVAHRRVSRGYSRWCDMMPDENDIAMIRLESRAIADTTEFTERTFAALCNALVRGDVEPPGDARGAMRMLLAYACVGRSVNLDGGGLRGGGDGAESDGMPGEYVYVGLRNAILGYDGYGGVRRTLAPDEYRDYVALLSGGSAPAGDAAAACGGASAHGDDGRIRDCRRRSVWMFPGMEDRFDSVRASLQARVREAMAAGIDLDAMDLGVVASDDASTIPEAWWRFHDVADKAVSRWLGGETIHAAAVDGHGHALAYRSTNPVAAYQDVNAWRLAEALERYEGERGWGSGGRLADLYRDRSHLSKGGGRAADRSIRDYADSARGAGDAVQYLAAVTGLGMMLGSDASVETFVRLIDLCDKRGGECFRKSCWTLIRVAKAKRLRLTVPGAHGRHIGVRLLALMLSDPERLAEAEREFKIANLRRAFAQRRGGGHGGDVAYPRQSRDGDSWRAVARDIDAAEHVVRGVMLAAFARLRATDRRWTAIRVMPADCVGSRIDPASGGACVFHGTSEHAGATTGKAAPRKGTGT